jgi:hypothetical protein
MEPQERMKFFARALCGHIVHMTCASRACRCLCTSTKRFLSQEFCAFLRGCEQHLFEHFVLAERDSVNIEDWTIGQRKMQLMRALVLCRTWRHYSVNVPASEEHTCPCTGAVRSTTMYVCMHTYIHTHIHTLHSDICKKWAFEIKAAAVVLCCRINKSGASNYVKTPKHLHYIHENTSTPAPRK